MGACGTRRQLETQMTTETATAEPVTAAHAAVETQAAAPAVETAPAAAPATGAAPAAPAKPTEAEVAAAQAKALDEMVLGWKAQLAADPKLGGDKLEVNRAVAAKALTLGTPEFAALLEKTGLIHNPEMFGYLHKVGKTISEDAFVPAGAQPNVGIASTAKSLYPNNP